MLISTVPLGPGHEGAPVLITIGSPLSIKSVFLLDFSSPAPQTFWDYVLCSHTVTLCVLPILIVVGDCGRKWPQKLDQGLSLSVYVNGGWETAGSPKVLL